MGKKKGKGKRGPTRRIGRHEDGIRFIFSNSDRANGQRERRGYQRNAFHLNKVESQQNQLVQVEVENFKHNPRLQLLELFQRLTLVSLQQTVNQVPLQSQHLRDTPDVVTVSHFRELGAMRRRFLTEQAERDGRLD
ncbi:UNVERIFIED_CONTAM: hypothetical protein HDU68_005677 [Siphonaria sp. JEL0065]|nr:hypothetical protein HDU68_005677 [Siphonaria sp. JEL0065]